MHQQKAAQLILPDHDTHCCCCVLHGSIFLSTTGGITFICCCSEHSPRSVRKPTKGNTGYCATAPTVCNIPNSRRNQMAVTWKRIILYIMLHHHRQTGHQRVTFNQHSWQNSLSPCHPATLSVRASENAKNQALMKCYAFWFCWDYLKPHMLCIREGIQGIDVCRTQVNQIHNWLTYR